MAKVATMSAGKKLTSAQVAAAMSRKPQKIVPIETAAPAPAAEPMNGFKTLADMEIQIASLISQRDQLKQSEVDALSGHAKTLGYKLVPIDTPDSEPTAKKAKGKGKAKAVKAGSTPADSEIVSFLKTSLAKGSKNIADLRTEFNKEFGKGPKLRLKNNKKYVDLVSLAGDMVKLKK